MPDDYDAYLLSDHWKARRRERLRIANGKCAACSTTKGIHVHHLTYARIFNEEMEDLLPLCETHHKAAEKLVKEGKLSRRGDPLFLATETVRLILSSAPKAIKRNRNKSKRKKRFRKIDKKNYRYTRPTEIERHAAMEAKTWMI